jgi:alpha-D-xyloside xylohydrolase
VTHYKERGRRVYFPGEQPWYDFWTGAAVPAGTGAKAAAPYDAIPIFVKAGLIVPFGLDVQYVAEKPADPITVFVYAGTDGQFTLYEDDGLTFDYERGTFSEIPIQWQDASRTLTIGARQGSFTGMLQQREFDIVLVSKDQAVAYSTATKPVSRVRYEGSAVTVNLPWTYTEPLNHSGTLVWLCSSLLDCAG